jgi:hypothetical protein
MWKFTIQDRFAFSRYTLVVLDKTINTITDVEIEGKGFYVFGRGDGSWIDQSNSFLTVSIR